MSQENYEPTNEEFEKALNEMDKQMEQSKDSLPTEGNIAQAMESIAAQFGEKFEAADPAAVPESEIIENHKREGWVLENIFNNAAEIKAEEDSKTEVKVIGLGDKFLVFKRKTQEQ